MTKTVSLTIDGQTVVAQAGQTVLQAAREAGIDIPTLCDHPALEPIGACRLCLIEISRTQPLHPACTYPVTEGLVVETRSPRVESARRFALELLFSERNHYCMYCEMSGDCELQDLGYRYSLDHWVYPTYTKRFAVDASRETFLMDHNRCILCRRCVRACSELVANHTLGMRERGAKTMISADMDLPFGQSSCVSCGTCLQVCPTGALVDKRSAFMGRNVQTERVASVCNQCSLGCGTEIVTRGGNVLRVEGQWDAQPNGGLLCHKGRFDPLYDERPRLTMPMVRKNGVLEETGWEAALEAVAQRLNGTAASKLSVLTSSNATNEALYLLSALFGQEPGAAQVGLLDGMLPARLEPQGTLADVAESDVLLVVGSDPTVDQPVASFLIKRAIDRGARLVLVYTRSQGVAEGDHGLAPFATMELAPTDIAQAVEVAARADRPVVVYGTGLTAGLAGALVRLKQARFIALEPGTNTRAAVSLGLGRHCDVEGLDTAFLLLGEQAPDGHAGLQGLAPETFTVVQACYASGLSERADVVLPMATWDERCGTLTNTEGRVQKANQAVQPQGEARADWEILSMLATRLGKPQPSFFEELSALAVQQLS
jgi:formate dehydrogenase major subunit